MPITKTTTLERFQAASSRADLADLLDIELKDLTYLLYKKTDDEKYSRFLIPKKSGGVREINAPIPQVKSLQRKLASKLEDCLIDINSLTGISNSASHGFRPGKSILTNASAHRNRRYVLNLDLKDFFPSITGGRIRGYLIGNNNFKFHKDVATTIAQIACLDGKLPQGSPCSPVISNLIAGILDFHLSRLASIHGCVYTRYADDISFSTNKKEIPRAIAIRDDSDENIWRIGRQLRGLITKSGFVINDEKTRIQYKTSRQQVTGLVVNKRVNVASEYRRIIRAYVFALINHGKFTIKKVIKGGDGHPQLTSEDGTHNQLHGMLGFVHSVDNVVRTHEKLNSSGGKNHEKSTGNLTIFRRFLLYTRFYTNDLPLVVCEGKTDGVYISNAIHQCKSIYPSLLAKSKDGKSDVLSFQFLKYARKHKKKKVVYLPNFSTVTILGGGSGGNGNLGRLVLAYKNELKHFKAPCGDFPVVFIVDNDKAGKDFFSLINKNFKKTISGAESFVHVFANLYVVPVPLGGEPSRSIEGLFLPSDVSKGLKGKPFDFSDDCDRTVSADKAAFAYEFVAERADELDWTGFHPLLKNLCSAMNDYKQFKAAA